MEPSTAHVQWNGKVTPVKMMWTSVNQRQIHVRMEELVQTLKVVTTARVQRNGKGTIVRMMWMSVHRRQIFVRMEEHVTMRREATAVLVSQDFQDQTVR
jgi:hypothetical protein